MGITQRLLCFFSFGGRKNIWYTTPLLLKRVLQSTQYILKIPLFLFSFCPFFFFFLSLFYVKSPGLTFNWSIKSLVGFSFFQELPKVEIAIFSKRTWLTVNCKQGSKYNGGTKSDVSLFFFFSFDFFLNSRRLLYLFMQSYWNNNIRLCVIEWKFIFHGLCECDSISTLLVQLYKIIHQFEDQSTRVPNCIKKNK